MATVQSLGMGHLLKCPKGWGRRVQLLDSLLMCIVQSPRDLDAADNAGVLDGLAEYL
jgi:hypothetical protein